VSEPTVVTRRPGGQMASRPLHFIWLVDGSGSMRVRGKIEALNAAIAGAIPHMQAVALANPQATIFVNAIRFGDEANWMVERLTPVSEFKWPEVEAGGVTALGEALTMVGEALQPPLIRDRALPPVLVLVTDGLPTDDFQAGLNHLLSKPWGRRAVRLVVALGEDAAGSEVQDWLRAFVSDDAPRPLQANNPETLAGQIRWISTAIVNSVCSPDTVGDPTSETGSSERRMAAPALPSAADVDLW
jgi:uncharacterized protein YegL